MSYINLSIVCALALTAIGTVLVQLVRSRR